MVASISKARSQTYYLDLANQDYYANALEEPGLWWGSGAERLGLSGEVNKADFTQLWNGYSADGAEKLTQNADKANRRPAWDMTFSAPKSVSSLWAVADEEMRVRLESAHQEAVADALCYLEDHAAYTRRGQGGEQLERAGLIVGTFQHGSSREHDPELHTHAVILNVTTRQDSTTGSLDSYALYTHTMTAGAMYRASLSTRLQAEGFTIEKRDKGLFEVSGVPDEVKRGWSKRSQAIAAYLESENLEDTPQNRQKAAEVTRQAKQHRSREELREEWQETGRQGGFDAEAVRQLCSQPHEQGRFAQERAKKEVLQESLERLTEKDSLFTERQLDRALAESAIGRGLRYDQILDVKQKFIFSREAVEVEYSRYERSFTTMATIEQEFNLKEATETLSHRRGHAVSEQHLFQALSERPTISREQRAALEHVTSRGDLKVVSGMAGTGKTFFLESAREVWERSGYEVVGVSLSGKAASGLEQEAKIRSYTIDSFFAKIDAEEEVGIATDARNTGSLWLNAHTVLVVDEAGMVDTKRMTRLVQEVEAAGAKLVLVGDAKQLQPVGAGGAFHSISTTVGQVELTDIRRQRQEWARQAVHDFASGDAEEGLTAYAKRGLLTTAEQRSHLYRAMIQDWSEQGGISASHDHLLLANTNKDVAELNRRAQKARHDAGELSEQKIRLGQGLIYQHDRIMFHANDTELGVKNGQFATVNAIDSIRKRLSVTLDGGEQRLIPLKDYGSISLGYAVTTHKAQGMTVENSYVLAGGGMQNRELSYVQMSRHRGEARIYTEGGTTEEAIATLANQMSRSQQKSLAIDRIAEQDEKQASTINR